MIREFELFHGSVVARMIHGVREAILIRPFEGFSNSAYVINSDIAIYVKYSSARLSPWRFSFKRQHQKELEELRAAFKKCFLILVCNRDGIVCLGEDELDQLLGDPEFPMEWLSAKRRIRQMYEVCGSKGPLQLKIGASDFPGRIFE